MDSIQIDFFDINDNLINFGIFGAKVDFNSISISYQFGYGLRKLSMKIKIEDNRSVVRKMFTSKVYKVTLSNGGEIEAVGIRSNEIPKYDFDKKELSVSFVGFKYILETVKMAREWKTEDFFGRLYVNVSEKQSYTQQAATKEVNGTLGIFAMLSDDETLTHGVTYVTYRWDFINQTDKAYSIEIPKVTYRSGEGVGFEVRNPTAGVRVVKVDATDTGDQILGITTPLPETPITGLDTSVISVGFLASDIYTADKPYGDGTTQFNGTYPGGTNTVILPFAWGEHVKYVNEVTLDIALSSGSSQVRAAIYDDTMTKRGEFDNTPTVTGGLPLAPYTFTRSGGMDIGSVDLGDPDKLYYLLLRFSNTAVNYSFKGQNTLTNPPNATFITNGYLRRSISSGAFPNMDNTFTEINNTPQWWVTMDFELISNVDDIYDQNDKVTFDKPIMKAKYTPSHSAYLAPNYTPIEILEDIILTTAPSFQWDASTIDSGINGGLELETFTTPYPKNASEIISELIRINSNSFLYSEVWAYDNGGVPRLHVISRDTSLDNKTYILDISKLSVMPIISQIDEIKNSIFVRYTDKEKLNKVLGPTNNPTLQDSESISNYGVRSFFYDAGEVSSTEALQIGESILREYKAPFPSGSITIKGKGLISNYSSGVLVDNIKVKSGHKILLLGYEDDLGNIDPVYQIMKADYNLGSDTLKITFNQSESLEVILRGFKKFRGSNI
jgi:hypothetical protein